MSKEFVRAILLSFTVILAFLISIGSLENYLIQINAFIFIIYLIAKRILSIDQSKINLISAIVFTFIIVSSVNSFGGIKSDFFFLYYFLIFALSLILEPIISVSTSLTIVVLYLVISPETQPLESLIPIFSLPLLTPFALFLGKEYQKVQSQNLIIENLNNSASKEKEDRVLFLSLVIKNGLSNISKNIENFMGDHELQNIKKTVSKMEKMINEYEKNN